MNHDIRNPDGIWINSEVFREEARTFEKYGYYTNAPVSRDPYSEYQTYWKEQERRCIQGYSVGGVRITGDHYNYLNFSQIKLTANQNYEGLVSRKEMKNMNQRAGKKIVTFPDFWDGDYDYFHILDIARWGASKKYIEKLQMMVTVHPDDIYGGKHVIVGKARRKGFSYKNAAVAANRFKREPDSISVIGAYDSAYLYPEGTTAMVDKYVDFYNEFTSWRRRKTIDRIDHQKDAYKLVLDGVEIEKGYKSQIISSTCRDNPDALRGKDATLILMEEAGKWPNLAATLASTLPTLKDGIYTTGILLLFGTGGGDNTNWETFEDNFYGPAANNFMRIHNDWDKGAQGTWGGYFFPDDLNKIGFIDKQGNSDRKTAYTFQESIRTKIAQSTQDPELLRRHKMEEALTPSEAFSRARSNIFPVEELEEHLRTVESNQLWRHGTSGTLRVDQNGELRFWPDLTLKPILQYPHKDLTSYEGAIVQYFPPYKIGGFVPEDLYIICHDPYDFDKSTNTESLGVTYVLMNPNNIVPGFEAGDLIVASYIGRPEDMDTYNKRLFDLAMYYNAKIGIENDRGDVVGYAKRNKHLFKYLEPEFQFGWTDTMQNNLGRGYGMSIAGGRENKKSRTGDVFIRDFLNEVRHVTADGKVVKNLHMINDPGLLKELIMYGKGNFDRVSALKIGMYHMKELEYQTRVASARKHKESVRKFFGTKLCA